MEAALNDRRHRMVAGLAALGASLAIALLLANQLHLLGSGLMTGVVVLLVAAGGALMFWQQRSLGRAAETERLQRAVIDLSPNAVVTSDSQGRIVNLNPAAERIFACPARSLGTVWMSDLVCMPAAPDAAPEAGRGGNILDKLGQKMILDGRRPDGSRFPAEMSILRVGTGAQTMFAAYVRDLTEQRNADAAHEAQQTRVHQTEKLSAMGSLLAGVAHELNNPLAILLTQASLLRDKAPTPDVQRRADRIHAAAQRAGRIVKSFLAMARQKTPVRTATDLNSIVEAALELVGYGLRSGGIVVKLELSPDLPLVDADRDLLGQVFANTIINAQQALADQPEPRIIRISTYQDGDFVVTDVADNGPGLPDDIREKIFEPYFTTRPAGAGTGIGLSVSRSVMNAHDGTIEALPSEGRGATFRITLDAVDFMEKKEEYGEPGGALSIMVVDDEPDVAESLAELLDVFGHRTVVLCSALDAIERAKQQRFDAVFTDLRMPGMNGLSLRQALRSYDDRLGRNTIIMTGDTVMGPRAGGSETDGLVLEKPFTADNVRALLERIRAS